MLNNFGGWRTKKAKKQIPTPNSEGGHNEYSESGRAGPITRCRFRASWPGRRPRTRMSTHWHGRTEISANGGGSGPRRAGGGPVVAVQHVTSAPINSGAASWGPRDCTVHNVVETWMDVVSTTCRERAPARATACEPGTPHRSTTVQYAMSCDWPPEMMVEREALEQQYERRIPPARPVVHNKLCCRKSIYISGCNKQTPYNYCTSKYTSSSRQTQTVLSSSPRTGRLPNACRYLCITFYYLNLWENTIAEWPMHA